MTANLIGFVAHASICFSCHHSNLLKCTKLLLVPFTDVVKCKPMNNQPVDWTSSTKGIGEDANISLVKGQSNKQPQTVLDAVNKLQAVKFTVAPVIAHAAKVMLNNASTGARPAFQDDRAGER